MGDSWGSVEKWFHSGHMETKANKMSPQIGHGYISSFFHNQKIFYWFMTYIPHNSLALLIQFSDIFVYSQNCVSITTSVEFFGFCFFIKFFFFFCQAACGILCPLHWKHRALTTEPPVKLQYFSSLLILLQSTTNFKQHKLI